MTRALIIGAGIAGPVTAMALRRAGIDSVVYEAHAPISREVGSYLTVATNGVEALSALDAHRPVVAAGFPTSHVVLSSGTGRRLGRVPIAGTRPTDAASITIKRARLHQALHEQAAARGVCFEFEKRLVGAETTPHGGAVARFDDGTEAIGDLLIGCDGVHSVTRGIIDRTAPRARYVGLLNFGGYTRDVAVPCEAGVWHLIFGKRAFFGYTTDAAGGAVWFVNAPRREIDAAEREAMTDAQWKQHLLELFARDHGPAARIIAAGELELTADNTYDLPKVPTWHRGGMIVIGDAAHAPSPTSGQGASMAIEDAVVLAKCLRDVPRVPRAFAAYERLRRRRVERIVAGGARQSGNKTLGPVGVKLRDLVLPLVFKYFITEKSLDRVFSYSIDWDSHVVLDGN
jgi:2-polyprenyl-6-methoxyphenol hydroxylase-like FAD-dependent oxidoreductase